MVSAAMAVQEQNEGTPSNTRLHSSDKMSSDVGTPIGKGIHMKEQFNDADDFAPKVRKPYTITKQRERWTEEEHNKFLEALKLYGRAWRKIEEHVGTKTAVQIRSHAQKFFSKAVRESHTGDSSSEKPIEIPPPRPKRKPVHPYPRKIVTQIKNGISIPEKPNGLASSKLSVSEQDNQSPTSVLSTVGSDASVGADSCVVPNGSPSQVSSALALNAEPEDENSSLEEQKSGLLSQNSDPEQEDSKGSTAQSLKLFGKTFSVTEYHGPSDSAGKPESVDKNEGTCLFPWRVMPGELSMTHMNGDYLYVKMMNDKSNATVALPWLTLCSGASLSNLEVHSPTPIRARSSCDKQNKDEQCLTHLNSDLTSASEAELDNGEVDSSKEVVEKSFLSYKLSKRILANSAGCSGKGFVPYKRCLLDQDSTISQTDITEEREKQRTRLCF